MFAEFLHLRPPYIILELLHPDKQIYKQTNRQTDRQTDRQTGRQFKHRLSIGLSKIFVRTIQFFKINVTFHSHFRTIREGVMF